MVSTRVLTSTTYTHTIWVWFLLPPSLSLPLSLFPSLSLFFSLLSFTLLILSALFANPDLGLRGHARCQIVQVQPHGQPARTAPVD